jgi:hypothetical protein
MSKHELITFGPTLSRQMSEPEMNFHTVRGCHSANLIGSALVWVTPSYHPDILNVDLNPLGTPPAIVSKALQVANERVRTVYSLGARPKLTIADPTNDNAYQVAQRLVDMCRESRQRAPALMAFDRTREDCVRLITVALVSGEMPR